MQNAFFIIALVFLLSACTSTSIQDQSSPMQGAIPAGKVENYAGDVSTVSGSVTTGQTQYRNAP